MRERERERGESEKAQQGREEHYTGSTNFCTGEGDGAGKQGVWGR
jgi:hypothetical protein